MHVARGQLAAPVVTTPASKSGRRRPAPRRGGCSVLPVSGTRLVAGDLAADDEVRARNVARAVAGPGSGRVRIWVGGVEALGLEPIFRSGSPRCERSTGEGPMTARPLRVPGPDHPIPPSSRTEGASSSVHGDAVLADTRDALVRSTRPATARLPTCRLADVDMTQLTPSDHASYCPYKGDARYHHVPLHRSQGPRTPSGATRRPTPPSRPSPGASPSIRTASRSSRKPATQADGCARGAALRPASTGHRAERPLTFRPGAHDCCIRCACVVHKVCI